ncbi:MAG: ATP-binding domain-containing protein [Ilumatobacteraceae bacterium]
MSDTSLFPELDLEQRQLAHSRACRDAMIAMFARVDPRDSADEFTKEYIEVTVAEALEDLRTPGAGEFFGRIDEERVAASGRADRWYIGRRHIEDPQHDPVVIDWRAPIAAPFYRATVHDPLGLAHRRRFMMTDGEITSYLDEQLNDPDHADAASGIPDPVLAEIGAARTGAMREIVATIQAEQDVVIRAPMQQALIVQGGPGTGKTAVGLHRAAYLLFEHRRRLASEGVLVVGPNQVFLDYIGNVLPSLGERSVQQRTVFDLCVPRVEIGATDTIEVARLKGDERMLDVLQRAALSGLKVPQHPVRVPIGARTHVIEADEFAGWVEAALGGNAAARPLNRRRDALKAIAERELLRRTDDDGAWSKAAPLRDALVSAWPVQQPKVVLQRLLSNGDALAAAADGCLTAAEQAVLLADGAKPGSKKRPWTAADQLLLDEVHSLLDGPPFLFGHVVVDEAQDHSAVALRVIGRRCPGGSFTILGDLAQSTTPAGQQQWPVVAKYLGAREYEVAHLTIGYRVPEPVLAVANLLLPFTAVDAIASRSVRMDGEPPTMRVARSAELATAVAEEVLIARHRHVLTGVVAPLRLHGDIANALLVHDLQAVSRVQDVQRDEIPIFTSEAVKGLEFDAVVVVNPAEIFDGTPRGARLLYVAMTRAVQVLRMVGDSAFDATEL